jgi:AAA+ ATPase superfamily predicted ATPase
VLNRSGYLYDEPHFLLQQEVSEVGSYFSIIKAIAAGNSKLSAISSVLEIKSTGLTKYLKTLIDLDILEREVPITEENPEKSKKGLYKIKDNYLRFWFAFVYPNMSFIESGHSRIVMNKIKNSMARNHIAFVYEDVCKERMWDLNAEGAWPFNFTKIGRYWDSKNEIDIVALDPEGKNLILGECKYWSQPVGISVLRDLEAKAGTVAWERDRRQVWYVLFSASGFTEELRALAGSRENLLLCDEVTS